MPPDAAPRILKSHSASPLGQPVAFNFTDLRRSCEEQLTETRERAQRMIGDAGGEAERIRKQAAEAGRKEGYRDGLKAAEAEAEDRIDRLAAERVAAQVETLLPAVRKLVDDLRVERDRWVSRWEAEAVRLSVAVAEKLLRRSIAADPQAADPLIADALRLAAGSPEVTLRLSPADRERLGRSGDSISAAIGKLGAAELVADPAISPGGCVIETRHGSIDGRLETQLERIAAELVG